MGATNTYRYVNASKVYEKGKADGVSGVKVYYLGTATSSLNVKSKLSSIYNKLSASNFILGFSSASSGNIFSVRHGAVDIVASVNVNARTPSLSYNSSTGVLTINNSGMSYYCDDDNSDGHSTWNSSSTLTYKIYCVYGTSITNV